MATTVDELTMNFQDEEGKLLVKELDKQILTKGTWATLMFKYQDMDKATGGYKAPKFAIRRFQKRNGEYKLMSKFTISSPAQATRICEILTQWNDGEAGDAGESGEANED
jgi:hypothetical protein